MYYFLDKFIVNRNFFEFQFVIGRGGFGKVWQVIMKKNKKKYALKEMSKVKIMDRRSEKSIKTERDFLSKLCHPFIVNMNCAFQDYDNLYLVMDLLTGGDLRYHICKIHFFSEKESKFFIACLLLGLEYIHSNNIIHRDIKPENLVFDDKGYLRITDFGVAKINKKDNSSETSGTPGYMAPEVLMAQNHSFPVDFFAIGVMGYEFMLGQRPYIGKSRKEIKHHVLRKQAKIGENDIVDGWSMESVDFINHCLKRKESRRLGFTAGVKDLKNHIWFKHFDWESLYNKTLRAPFIPPNGGNFDKKYCEAIENLSQETLERYQGYRAKKYFRHLFEGYTYINYELSQITSGREINTKVSANTKYNKLVISSNNMSVNDKTKNKNYNKITSPIFLNNDIQKKNKLYNTNNNYKNEYINIFNPNLVLSKENNENINFQKQIDEENFKNEKYNFQNTIKLGELNIDMEKNEEIILINMPASSTRLINNSNNINKIKSIHEKKKIGRNKQIRSSSLSQFNLENNKYQNYTNYTKRKYFGLNDNKYNNNNDNFISNINLGDRGEYFSKLYKSGSMSNLNEDQIQIKFPYKNKNLDDNIDYINSQRLKYDSSKYYSNKNSNPTPGIYLQQFNRGKTMIHEYRNINPGSQTKIKNILNLSSYKYKFNHGGKIGYNLNNKISIVPGNSLKHIKRSESTGFINGTYINNNNNTYKSNRNNNLTKHYMGLSNSQINIYNKGI